MAAMLGLLFLPLAAAAEFLAPLQSLCETLLEAQITDAADPNFGALRCPSSNPDNRPLHSRAAEAVYPVAVLYRETGEERYARAARHLGNWLVRIQQSSGAWGENSPHHDGWTGTTADQLLSLAGALPLLRAHLSEDEKRAWAVSIHRAAGHVLRTFPISNINYQPTGAVALVLAQRAVEDPSPEWAAKARELMDLTYAGVGDDGLLHGEGLGVDVGYNLAQSIGFVALYGLLCDDRVALAAATRLLEAHLPFVYPNGSIDNSWGTRSFKWTYESGTKTAPGVHFTFALLAARDRRFAAAGRGALRYLENHGIRNGRVVHGPHEHDSVHPPCLYGTFTRAQSLALALVYGALRPADGTTAWHPAPPWVRHYPALHVAVARTEGVMGTVSAYAEVGRYGPGLVLRGGSISNLWMRDYGRLGFVQTSSVARYKREEGPHMPIETGLLPLTPRIEAQEDGTLWSSLHDRHARIAAAGGEGDTITIVAEGGLCDVDGREGGVHFVITHRFRADSWTKEYSLKSARSIRLRVVEPFVREEGFKIEQTDETVLVLHAGARRWQLRVDGPAGSFVLRHGQDQHRYWCPFPAVACYPVSIELTLPAGKEIRAQLHFAPVPAGS